MKFCVKNPGAIFNNVSLRLVTSRDTTRNKVVTHSSPMHFIKGSETPERSHITPLGISLLEVQNALSDIGAIIQVSNRYYDRGKGGQFLCWHIIISWNLLKWQMYLSLTGFWCLSPKRCQPSEEFELTANSLGAHMKVTGSSHESSHGMDHGELILRTFI